MKIPRCRTLVSALLAAAGFASCALTDQEDSKMSQDFFTAITQGDTNKVEEMLRAEPALARARDPKGVSAILKATYHGKKDVVGLLLSSGVELDVFEAAATGQAERVRALVKSDPALANAFASDGFMPLGLAVFFGHPETVSVLLAAGADVNAPTRESMKVTPLHSAAAARHLAIARELIARGANVRAGADNGFTPLHEVAATGQIEFARLLLEHGAEVNAKTKDGKTPLVFALERKQTEMAGFLRERGGTP